MTRAITPVIERVWRYVDATGDCWEWSGVMGPLGYGRITLGRKGEGSGAVHRVVYEALVGPIPKGLELDHLCRNHACCNPDHLEPVTPRVNLMRGWSVSSINARKTHCSEGHEFTPANARIDRRGHRNCRACDQPGGKHHKPYVPRRAVNPNDRRQTCLCGHKFRAHKTGQCVGLTVGPDRIFGAFCPCNSWVARWRPRPW